MLYKTLHIIILSCEIKLNMDSILFFFCFSYDLGDPNIVKLDIKIVFI